jgi:hypothetical protein
MPQSLWGWLLCCQRECDTPVLRLVMLMTIIVYLTMISSLSVYERKIIFIRGERKNYFNKICYQMVNDHVLSSFVYVMFSTSPFRLDVGSSCYLRFHHLSNIWLSLSYSFLHNSSPSLSWVQIFSAHCSQTLSIRSLRTTYQVLHPYKTTGSITFCTFKLLLICLNTFSILITLI